MVSLWPYWIIQLVYISFAWRTHIISLEVSLIFRRCRLIFSIFPSLGTNLLFALGVAISSRRSNP